MDEPKRIVLVGELPDREWCRPLGALWDLQDHGYVELSVVDIKEEIRIPTEDADALICRPSRGGHLSSKNVDAPKRQLVVGTLSKGVDHIRIPDGWIREIVSATGDANAASVADHTLNLGSEILRPVGEAASEMLRHGWSVNIESTARQFDGLTWGCLGAGAQVKYLLPQLVARRCEAVMVFHPELDRPRFNAVVSGLPPAEVRTTVNGFELLQPRPGGGSTTITGICGTHQFSEFLGLVDVLSLHVPAHAGTHSRYSFATEQIISKTNIGLMKQTAGIVNVARGALVNERDVVAALQQGQLGGYAADVICATAEGSGDPDDSPLWTEFRRLDSSRKTGELCEARLYLTPHVGGGTRQALSAVAESVIPRLLEILGLPQLEES